MIYVPRRFLFLHIPRTAGIAITTAFMQTYTDSNPSVVVSTASYPRAYRRHARAAELVHLLPDWSRIEKFAVIRNPWRAIESNYRRMQAFKPHVDSFTAQDLHQDWNADFYKSVYESLKWPFAKWIPRRYGYLSPGTGDWRHFCLTDQGGDLGVRAFRFEELKSEWPAMRRIMGLRDWDLPLLNQVPCVPTEWTEEAIRFVRARFSDDFRRFGYPDAP